MKDELQRFVHHENIAHYKKLIAESERDPSHDDARHKMLLRLLADELAEDTGRRTGKRSRHGAAANVNAALAKLPNQIYGGGYDHHPRRDDETLLDPVHDYAQPNRNNIDPVLG
jgi:hypothetical protein